MRRSARDDAVVVAIHSAESHPSRRVRILAAIHSPIIRSAILQATRSRDTPVTEALIVLGGIDDLIDHRVYTPASGLVRPGAGAGRIRLPCEDVAIKRSDGSEVRRLFAVFLSPETIDMFIGLGNLADDVADRAAALKLPHPVGTVRIGRALEHVPVELLHHGSRVSCTRLLRRRECGRQRQREKQDRCAVHGVPPASLRIRLCAGAS
jgi:hypothetical protein